MSKRKNMAQLPGNTYFGMTAKNISDHYKLAKFQRGIFYSKIRQEEDLRAKREAGIERRMETYGVPKYKTFESLVNDYIVGALTDEEYFEEYKKWYNVYSDRGSDAKMRWLKEQYAYYNAQYEYWKDRRDKDRRERLWDGWARQSHDSPNAVWRKARKRKRDREWARKHRAQLREQRPKVLKPRAAHRSPKWKKEHANELLLIKKSTKYQKRPWLLFNGEPGSGTGTSDGKNTKASDKASDKRKEVDD